MADEIRLIAKGGSSSQEGVRFRVRPKITENRSATYVDAQLPGTNGVVVYATTANNKFSFNVTFVSRTVDEAARTFREISLLKSWLIPEGEKVANPAIIKLYGYKNVFDGIPTVLQSLNISYSDEVDYIDSGLAWVPIIQTASFNLIETHTDKEAEAFNISAFKQGLMSGY